MNNQIFCLPRRAQPVAKRKVPLRRSIAWGLAMVGSSALAQTGPLAQDRAVPLGSTREVGILLDPASCANDGFASPILLTFDFGEVFVPRDAAVGSVIGARVQRVTAFDSKLVCRSGAVLSFVMQRPGPLPQLPTAGNVAYNGNWVYPTNIPGIGVAIYANGSSLTCPDHAGTDFTVNLTVCNVEPHVVVHMSDRAVYAWLIKTGPISAGSHTLDSTNPAYTGSATGIGQFTRGYLRGTITQAECALPAAPGNQIRVDLGDWEKRHFNGKGTTTDAVGFNITLQSCIAGSYDSTPSWNYFTGNYANVRFDPAKGSTTVDAANGIISVGTGSTATGVGIQILQANGTSPMRIGEWNRLQHVQDGITTLRFFGRYYQTGDTVSVGSANGTVNFTIEYR